MSLITEQPRWNFEQEPVDEYNDETSYNLRAYFDRMDDAKLLQPRHDPRRRDVALRRDQRHLVARHRRQRARQLDSEHDAELAVGQIGDPAAAQVLRDLGDLRFRVRIDAADQRAAHRIAARDHRLRVDVRRRRRHLGVLLRLRGDPAPVVDRAVVGRDLDVRQRRHHPRAHFLRESVHHAEHDDQRHHAERDARHRDRRDERNERVAPPGAAPGARVAQADAYFVREIQGGFRKARAFYRSGSARHARTGP